MEVFHPPLLLQAFVDRYPGAAVRAVDLTIAILHAAAGTIEQSLGADGNRADTTGVVQTAVTTQAAALFELAKAADIAEEFGIGPGHNLLIAGLGHGLDTGATRKHQQEIGLLHLFFAGAQVATRTEHVAGLIDNDRAGHFLAGRRQLVLHPEDLFLAAGFADRGALGAADDKDTGSAFQGGEDLIKRLLGGYDHKNSSRTDMAGARCLLRSRVVFCKVGVQSKHINSTCIQVDRFKPSRFLKPRRFLLEYRSP